MFNFRQIAAFVAVYEEGSFSRAAARVHATQPGLSMQVARLEETLGLPLFRRSAKGVLPTQAGVRLYERATEILRDLAAAEAEIRALKGTLSGCVRVGLMPAFTHSILAAALLEFKTRHPHVELAIAEAYSPTLSDGVAAGAHDFAVVPAEQDRTGLRASPFGRDRELLVSGKDSPLAHLAPVRLADLPPLSLVLPSRGNSRRDTLDRVFQAQGITIAAILEVDAMAATLDIVTGGDWMTILPATLCARDLEPGTRKLHPLVDPELHVDYVRIERRSAALSPAAALFAETLAAHFRSTHDAVEAAIGK
ncbi:MAG: LysR family transcriptional regulator [Alphaproteobacteria bacterium]|nr:MAG: LysR family transcriptional regulator [Alphaproteobacteria bacterium]